MADRSAPAHHYLAVLEPFSNEELDRISQLKRFFEWAQGDPDFGKSVDTGDLTPDYRARLKRIGVMFEPEALSLLWESPELAQQYLTQCGCGGGVTATLTEASRLAIERYPLLDLWAHFSSRKNAIYRDLRKQIFCVPQNPTFDAWRMRRIAAVRSELGFFGHFIDHPILAFELGDGCSVGCWFCAFAARKLTKNLDYAENADLFRRVTGVCVDLFGKGPASMALLYYGTEPHDNPNYLDYVKDFAAITGNTVCTSTTAGTDAKWMHEMIDYYREGTHPWPRLSVLSKGMLYKIHELYSPQELRDVELLMQMREHPRRKVSGGRILAEDAGMRDREDGHYLDEMVPQGSIACVTGFLINLVNRTIQVISPCYASQRWVYGYRIFDETTFADASDFRRAMQTLIDRAMPSAPLPNDRARFRDDLVYRETAEGFDLVSPNQIHHFSGKEVYAPLGKLVAEGMHTYSDLYDLMFDPYGVNPMLTVAVTQSLFDGGFLDELRFVPSNVH